jgi:hypothetical protein
MKEYTRNLAIIVCDTVSLFSDEFIVHEGV